MEGSGQPHTQTLRSWFTDRVVVVGLGLVLAQVVLRVWALAGSWFYADDYRLLLQALGRPLTLTYLLEPFDSQFMPVGRLLAWVASRGEPLDWPLAAALVLLLQLGAGIACLWMLTTLFGTRWEVLLLLAVYLTSVVPLTAFMWWAAALNHVPMQIAFFVAVGAWVRYLRDRRPASLALVLLAVTAGLLAYVKAMLVPLVLAYLALAYFATGGPVRRVREVWRSYWPAVVLGAAAAVAYLVHYVVRVPQPFEEGGERSLTALADAMLGRALATGVVGGPWRWATSDSPNALADPPEVAVRLAWLSVAAVVGYAVFRRVRTGRAWFLLGGYAAAMYVLLATSRGQVFGTEVALQYRYLADGAVVLVLCLGLAFLPLPGAPGSSEPRDAPLLALAVPRPLVAGLVLAVSAGGVLSTVRYVDHWHQDDGRRSYLANLRDGLRDLPNAALADRGVPEQVVPSIIAPYNELSRLVPLTGEEARFPEAGHVLHVVDDEGRLHEADVDPQVGSGAGPDRDCGWRLRGDAVEVPLDTEVYAWDQWLRIGYLSSTDTPIRVLTGDHEVQTEVLQGLDELYVKVQDTFDTVVLDGIDPGATVCITEIEAGPLEPAGGAVG